MTRRAVIVGEGVAKIVRIAKVGTRDTDYTSDDWTRRVFRHADPLRPLAHDLLLKILDDPSRGSMAQVFDSLQETPAKDAFRLALLQELRWARRLIDAAIKHLDPTVKDP